MTEPSPEPVGTAAEEAAKLLRALAAGAASARSDDADGHECPNGWCPVCRVAEWVRDNPEVVDNVSDAALALARTLRDALDSIVSPRTPTD